MADAAEQDEQKQEEIWERLASMAAPGGTSLEPLLRGFFDSGFQAQVQEFVAQRAPEFAVTCADGSHPLVWTSFHNEYREMFERHMDAILAGVALSQEEFHEFCRWLQASSEIFDDDTEGLYPFIEAVTSSEDYQVFLKVMFAEVRKQQLAQEPAAEQAGFQTQELAVCVPEGMTAGQAVTVEYLGSSYELVIPEGYEPGMTFQAAVSIPC
eukprot:TRINITY_DN12972_c2_g1_i1.p1 TRINITY_DN12972_c2_g1~~TRINITY_DN12972_c2_g1_i1.p1  ORF type:complete len:221 (+),score=55.95 TRINITY_DN12972_c2_g1_i1:32-664(+)